MVASELCKVFLPLVNCLRCKLEMTQTSISYRSAMSRPAEQPASHRGLRVADHSRTALGSGHETLSVHILKCVRLSDYGM